MHSLKKASKKSLLANQELCICRFLRGEVPVAWLRVQIVAYEVSQLLQHEHARFSAVVVMGDGFWFKIHRGHSDETSVTTTFYEVIENSRARVPLPGAAEKLAVEADEFTARIASFLKPVGVNLPRHVIVRIFDDALQKRRFGRVVYHGSP